MAGDYYIGLLLLLIRSCFSFSTILFNDLFNDLFSDLFKVFVFIDLFSLSYRFYKDPGFNEFLFLLVYMLFYFYLFLSLLRFFVDILELFSLSFDCALFNFGYLLNTGGFVSLFYTFGCYIVWD